MLNNTAPLKLYADEYDLVNVDPSSESVTQLYTHLWQTYRHVTIYMHCRQDGTHTLLYTVQHTDTSQSTFAASKMEHILY